MIKIFITNDHEIIRKGFKMLLEEENDIAVIGEAENGEVTLEKLKTMQPDIILLDLDMPKINGITLINEILNQSPNVKILIVSIFPEDGNAIKLLKAGASGYLSKSAALEDLILAIRSIYKNGKYISENISKILMETLIQENNSNKLNLLSLREYEVFFKLVHGITQKQIAIEMNLSISTINLIKNNICTKFNLKSEKELLYYAVKNNLIQQK